MHEPDLKKLITGFLLLALFSGSGTLALSRFLPTRANTEPQSAALTLKNAFLKDGAGGLSVSGLNGYQNLTQNLADNIAQKFIQSNLSGPSLTGNSQGINVPGDIKDVVSQYLDSSSIDPSKIPAPKVDEKRIQIIKNPSEEDVSDYFTSIQTILSGFQGQDFKNLNNKAKNGNGKSLLGSFVLFYSDLETKLYDLKVPEPELKLQKDLILLINTPVTIFSQNVNNDPLMASMVLTASQKILEDTQVDILKELNLLKLGGVVSAPRPEMWLTVLGVQKAYATGILVVDIINWIENFISALFDDLSYYLEYDGWYGTILTEQLKDKILKMVVDAILNWANGGSSGANPSFVTNWSSFLKDSYVNAASAAIAEVTSGVCEPFRTQIQLQLYSLYGESSLKGLVNPQISDLATCSLEQSVSSLDDFYGDFNEGGWAGYLALTDLSGNNPYSALYTASQAVGEAALKQQEADKAKASAGSGYVGTERCGNGNSPMDGYCGDGSAPEVTTPGENVSQSTSDSLTSAIHRIVNANDWKGLAAQLALFAITKITAGGNKGIRYSEATGNAPADKYAVCSGYKPDSQDYLDCKENIDQAGNIGAGHGSKELLLTQAKQALSDASKALEYVRISIDTASTSIQILTSVASSSSQCPSEAADATNELPGLNQEYSDLLAKEEDLVSKISGLNDLISEVQTHEPQDDQDFFLQKLDDFQTEFGGPAALARAKGEAVSESQNLQEKLQQSSDLLKACLAH